MPPRDCDRRNRCLVAAGVPIEVDSVETSGGLKAIPAVIEQIGHAEVGVPRKETQSVTPVVSQNSNGELSGIAVVIIEHATEALAAANLTFG